MSHYDTQSIVTVTGVIKSVYAPIDCVLHSRYMTVSAWDTGNFRKTAKEFRGSLDGRGTPLRYPFPNEARRNSVGK